MKLALRTLLALLALAACTTASGLDKNTSANNHNRVNAITYFSYDDLESIFTRGAMLWTESRNSELKAIVMMLDGEIVKITEHSNNFNVAAALIQGFIDASDCNVSGAVEKIVGIAVTLRAISLLRTLQHFYIWPSLEKFHWFQAISYKSEWYDESAWKGSPVPMNWNKNLSAIFVADNPILLNDLKSGIFPGNSLTITNSLLDLIVKYDSLNIYQSLYPTFIITHIKELAESGSFKILRFLVESQSINLHLEDYHPPNTLPEDFGFFWMQGYRYLPIDSFLTMACEYGRKDVLKFLRQLDSFLLTPHFVHLIPAANNGHLSILEWSLNHCFLTRSADIAQALILNGHFSVFKQLQEKLKLSADNMQRIADHSAEQERLDTVKWLYETFKIVPQQYPLGKTSIEILEWVKLASPQTITIELAKNANLSNLKWLLKNHPHLLTDDVKLEHSLKVESFEKLEWMIFQGWKAWPDMEKAASLGEIEIFKFYYNNFQRKPEESEVCAAASQGHTSFLKWAYSIDPSCIGKSALSHAASNCRLEAAKYLESILNLRDTVLRIDPFTMFSSENLEHIKWVYQTYKLEQPVSYLCLQWSIKHGHLHVINWAIENQLILKTDERYLKLAAQNGQFLIFQNLIDYGIIITEFKDIIKRAFGFGSLGIVKCLVTKFPESVKTLEHELLTSRNCHVARWLQDHSF